LQNVTRRKAQNRSQIRSFAARWRNQTVYECRFSLAVHTIRSTVFN